MIFYSLQGPVGIRGRPGREGDPGLIGKEGPVGAKGRTGARGAEGESGLLGPPGTPGPPGKPGPAGGLFDAGALAGYFSIPEQLQEKGPGMKHVGQQGKYYNYYRTTVVEREKRRDAIGLLDDLEMRIEAERRPDGSRGFPAKTCHDIQMCFPDSESGIQCVRNKTKR